MEITGSSKNALDLASHGSALVAIMDDELVSLRAKKYC
uniref:Glycerol-3-phosphate responsive antiterminator n=2 Tax=Bursaphelenchus xylophilus TaxID=6326 RepID=A0A1I7SMY1_BURXY